jgi:class 3 adenylate cyclase
VETRAALCPVRIGRDDEIALLTGEIERARDGKGGLLLVSGSAGVGKSSLVAEAQRIAADHGLRSLIGSCSSESPAPYGPFVGAIRRQVRTRDEAELRELFGGPALLAAALLPEVAGLVALPASAPRPDELFLSVWQLLRRLSGPRGAILVLEDLHWADTDSLRLLTYLARELVDLPLLVVGTYRDDELHRRHPLRAMLAELGRERRFTALSLQPLGLAEIQRMLSAILDDTQIGEEFAMSVLQRTDGNPFFVEELMKVLIEQGDVYTEAGDWARRDLDAIEMPVSVRETLLARIRDLDPALTQILELAALSGESIDLAVLARAADVEPSLVEDAIEAGLRLQILIERHDYGVPSYAFRHALTREALADEPRGPQRQRARRRIAEALVAVHADEVDAMAAEVADHYADAGEIELCVEYGVRAARAASASWAFDEVVRQWERVVRLSTRTGVSRIDLLLEAADAVGGVPDRKLAAACATEARKLAHEIDDPAREAEALRCLEFDRWFTGDGPGGLALAREALDVVHGRDDYAEATVIRNLSRRLTLADRGDEAESMIAEGIELAQRSGNLSALSGLHGTRLLMTTPGPAFDEAFNAALEAAQAANDWEAEANLRINAGFICLWAGALRRSEECYLHGLDSAASWTRLAEGHLDPYFEAGYAWTLSLTGRYDEADELALRAVDSTSVPARIVGLTALCETAERRSSGGDSDRVELICALALPTDENQRIAPALSARARYLLDSEGVDAALPVFWEVLETTTWDTLRVGSHWLFSPDCARALAVAGRVDDLAAWVEGLERLTGNDKNPHNVAAQTICTAYLAAARGDVASARTGFGSAAARYAAMPCPARQVEALLGLADLEWSAGGPDSGADAAQQALQIAERIGAGQLIDAAHTLMARTQAVPVLATVMITDIVGSTARAVEIGDRAWRQLLERHHAVVRRELARYDGREMDTAGDGFLAAFASPAQAIRCASAVRAELARIDLPIRVGLHTGECQQSGDKLTGIAIHIAARVAARADAGVILVSSTVRDLVAGSGFQFVDVGERELKGVPGRWRLFELCA